MSGNIKNLSDLVSKDAKLATIIAPFEEKESLQTDSLPFQPRIPSIASKTIGSFTANANIELKFENGDYNLKGHKEILTNAERMGTEILAAADRQGIKITDLPEFKNADLNNDGKISAVEVGAIVLASSMETGRLVKKHDQPTAVDLQYYDAGVVSTFKNNLKGADIAKLLDPKTADLARQIAQQLLGDNGMSGPTNTSEANKQFVKNTENDVPRPREDRTFNC